ncbi:MAG: amidase domain-containing protein [Tissierellales bacterium]
MIVFIRLKMLRTLLIIITLLVIILLGIYVHYLSSINSTFFIEDSIKEFLTSKVQEIFSKRNKAILDEKIEILDGLYDKSLRNGQWAYEHEIKKMKYLHNWSHRQSVSFTKVDSQLLIRSVKEKGNGYILNILASTEYEYVYLDSPEIKNTFRIGTYHSLDLMAKDDKFLITKEWYTDPFADSLLLDELKNEEIKKIILSGENKDLSSLNEGRMKAVKYADEFCGAASLPEYGFKYNPKYKNYNSLGGDCTNFASQVMHAGGFKRNDTWNYSNGSGSKAWVNAQAFKNYMLYSGRASLITSGNYDKVLKASYKLLPGDIIAYEKKGTIAHISVITGIDSKGYALVNSHNSDRYKVPWDLGWNNKGIKFWLIHTHF